MKYHKDLLVEHNHHIREHINLYIHTNMSDAIIDSVTDVFTKLNINDYKLHRHVPIMTSEEHTTALTSMIQSIPNLTD